MNTNYFFLIKLFLLFPVFTCFSQSKVNFDTIRGNCIYGDNNQSAAVCAKYQRRNRSFETNTEAYSAIEKLLKPIGLKPNFVTVPCDNINNCAAIVWADGLRYIIYDKKFMKSISISANTNWTNLSILAHEIGHHLNGHTLISTNLSETRQEELEADEFSGFILAKLGATLEQAQAAMKNAHHPSCSEDIHYTHPCLTKRLAAIEKGYNDEKNNNTTPSKTTIFPPNKEPVPVTDIKTKTPQTTKKSDIKKYYYYIDENGNKSEKQFASIKSAESEMKLLKIYGQIFSNENDIIKVEKKVRKPLQLSINLNINNQNTVGNIGNYLVNNPNGAIIYFQDSQGNLYNSGFNFTYGQIIYIKSWTNNMGITTARLNNLDYDPVYVSSSDIIFQN